MIPAQLKVHTFTVYPDPGDGAYGPVFGDPFTVAGYAEGKTRQVVDTTGTLVTSGTTMYVDPDDRLTVGAEVEWDRDLPAGTRRVVVAVDLFDTNGLTGLDHMAVALL